jgi:hypothetical protein
MEPVTFRFSVFRSTVGNKERNTRKRSSFIDDLFNDALSITRTMSKLAWQKSNSHFITFTFRSTGNSSLIIHWLLTFATCGVSYCTTGPVTGLICSSKYKNVNFLIIKCMILDFP